MADAQDNNMQAVIDAARAAGDWKALDSNARYERIFVPGFGDHASRVEQIDLEPGLPAPVRKRGTTTVFDPVSFNSILAANGDAGSITVYVNRDPVRPTVVAILNGNGAGGAGWGDFRAQIEFRQTPQWKKWLSIDGKLLSQQEFAEFIEDNQLDILEPSGAQALEIATYLESTNSVSFKSGVRLSSGAVQLQNLENIDAKVGPGSIAIPEMFKLSITPLQGSPMYSVPARFRYRISDGKLLLGIKLQRVEELMKQLLGEMVDQIEIGDAIALVEGLAPEATK